MQNFSRSVWGRRNLKKKDHWERIDISKYRPNKPVVFVILGNGTLTEESVNGGCKLVENHLQLLFKDGENDNVYENVDIVGVAFGKEHESDQRGSLSRNEVEQFVNDFLMPLVKDKKGKFIDLDEALRRLSQITFFTYCRGQYEVELLLRRFYERLSNEGAYGEDLLKLFDSMWEISFAPLTSDAMIPMVRVDSKYDALLNIGWRYEEDDAIELIGYSLNGVLVRYEQKGDQVLSSDGYSEALRGCAHIYSSRLRNDIESNEHDIGLLSRDKNWNSRYEKNADCVSQMVAWAVSRAVENGVDNSRSKKYIPKMSLEELIEELGTVKKCFKKEDLMSKQLY